MPEEPPPGGGVRPLDRLDARDARVLLLWLLAALIGAGVAYRYFFYAFPEASVNFKVTRAQALDAARGFAVAQGAQLDGCQSTVVFNVEDEAKTYLERELGLDQANRLMSSQVNVWYWEARFFWPLRKEEYRVRVDPGGRVVGYDHVADEAAPGAQLGRAEALTRALQFLTGTLHTPLQTYTFLPEEANSVARPSRTDWSFTWERTGFRAKDAPYRLQVNLQGDRVGGYAEFLKVPEEWTRSFARLRSSNDLLEEIALIPYALLLGGALSVVLAMGRRGQMRWGGALKLGLFVLLLYFVMQLNDWPMTRAGYDTNSSYSSFVAGQMGAAIGSSFLLTLLVIIAVLPGEPLYRAGQPDRLRLGSAFTWAGLQTKEFFRSGVVGICLAAVHIGYVVLFYVAGRHLGFWAPQDLQYSDTLSTALPWIYPLTIAIYAATSEEFLFRLFSVRFLSRVTKSRVLAVVLPAFAWGFLHSNYPQEPAYIRGIEVGSIGVVAGLVLLRWGIVATLVWHYTVDAFLIGLSLMRSADAYNRISGTIVGLGALIPVSLAGALYLARGGFPNQEALLNRAEPLPEARPAPAEAPAVTHAPAYTALPARAAAVLTLCSALAMVPLWTASPQVIGDFVRFSMDAKQAEAQAGAALRRQGVDPTGYRSAATIQYTYSALVNEFLRRSIGIAAANQIYRDRVPSAFWTVRYFRDSRPEEYTVVLQPDGVLHSIHHTLAEAAPGANLRKEDATARAETFLRDAKGLDLAQWRLVEATSDKLPARTDHDFVWEQIASLAPAATGEEGAHERIELKVQGDEVSGYRIFIHLPEDWLRQQEQTTLAGTAQTIGMVALFGGLAGAVLVAFFGNLRQPAMSAVPWRRLARWLLIVPAASAATFATLGPQYLARYSTEDPFKTYVARTLIGTSLGVMLSYSAAIFLFGLAWFFLARSIGAERLPQESMPAQYYRDAFLVGVGGALILLGINRLSDVLTRIWPVPQRALPAWVPQGLEFSWPALHALSSAVSFSFLAVGILALALGFASCYLPRGWMQMALLLACALLLTPSGTAGEFTQRSLTLFAVLTVIWWGSRCIVQLNLLGYLLAALLVSLAEPAADLLRQPNAFLHANGVAVLAAGTVLLLWPLAAWRWQARNSWA